MCGKWPISNVFLRGGTATRFFRKSRNNDAISVVTLNGFEGFTTAVPPLLHKKENFFNRKSSKNIVLVRVPRSAQQCSSSSPLICGSSVCNTSASQGGTLTKYCIENYKLFNSLTISLITSNPFCQN